jgi:hypothetical protein
MPLPSGFSPLDEWAPHITGAVEPMRLVSPIRFRRDAAIGIYFGLSAQECFNGRARFAESGC